MGNRWFRKYGDVQRAPRYFFVTDIVTLCHICFGGGPTHPSYIHPWGPVVQLIWSRGALSCTGDVDVRTTHSRAMAMQIIRSFYDTYKKHNLT